MNILYNHKQCINTYNFKPKYIAIFTQHYTTIFSDGIVITDILVAP